jgi:hypothetical protein
MGYMVWERGEKGGRRAKEGQVTRYYTTILQYLGRQFYAFLINIH